MGTVKRRVLDFDFEKVCSISLQTTNVYACLVCGKYYQGRGRGSHAYVHSVQFDHHVYLNLLTKKFYCLPDDYEIIDSSLDDIKGMLDPSFTRDEIQKLDKQPTICRTLDGKQYVAGVVGLNNLGFNDYINVVVQTLSHSSLFRNYFLLPQNYEKHSNQASSRLVSRLGTLIRKMWSSKNFKNQVSPHELLQEISLASRKKFSIGVRENPMTFISWLLNTLHKDLAGSKKRQSIVSKCFQGEVRVITSKDEIPENDSRKSNSSAKEKKTITTVSNTPFMFLSLDIPPPPLFKDEKEKTVIPQEPLFTLLSKFDGVSKHFNPHTKETKIYRITKLPNYLILHIQRFTNNLWYTEKNTTIVNFPMKSLDMSPYCDNPQEQGGCIYNLIANIRHNGTVENFWYNLHVLQKNTDKWYDIQDLIVEEAMPPLIALSEAYIQFYERVQT
uniref:USP domain-containing protein n=1 Tax=Arcella intermedia TaxID=1963864 RepID=A0A6B2L3F3_9EUKA